MSIRFADWVVSVRCPGAGPVVVPPANLANAQTHEFSDLVNIPPGFSQPNCENQIHTFLQDMS